MPEADQKSILVSICTDCSQKKDRIKKSGPKISTSGPNIPDMDHQFGILKDLQTAFAKHVFRNHMQEAFLELFDRAYPEDILDYTKDQRIFISLSGMFHFVDALFIYSVNLTVHFNQRPLGFGRTVHFHHFGSFTFTPTHQYHYEPPNETFKDVSSKLKIKNELISEFDSREHLLECLVASCLVPGWAGHKSRIINGSQGSTDKNQSVSVPSVP